MSPTPSTWRRSSIRPAFQLERERSDDRADRDKALHDLRSRRVNILFAADLFNEGLDVPDVDTVLFLRPTESATVFLQQLGPRAPPHTRQGGPHGPRLRRLPPQRVSLRPEAAGADRSHSSRARTSGERWLPVPSGRMLYRDGPSVADPGPGKHSLPDRQPLATDRGRAALHRRPGPGGSSSTESGIELSDILRRGSHSWTRLRRDAGLATDAGSELEESLLRRVRAFAHVDDPDRAASYRRLLADDSPSYDALAPDDQRRARMLFFSLWSDGGGHTSYRGRPGGAQRREGNAA